MARAKAPRAKPPSVNELLKALEKKSSKAYRDGLGRYGITAPKAFGVPMNAIHAIAKQTGRDHTLAAGLWKTGWYEARLLAAFVAEPERLTPAEMDRWAKDFDNWAVCDTACFHLFDRTPHAFKKISAWAKRREEFVRRAGFALLASAALHHENTPDEAFARCLPLIERAAGDERNFVKKAVLWALRGIGGRGADLNAQALAVAKRLADSDEASARFIGKGALRELASPAAKRRVTARDAKKAPQKR